MNKEHFHWVKTWWSSPANVKSFDRNSTVDSVIQELLTEYEEQSAKIKAYDCVKSDLDREYRIGDALRKSLIVQSTELKELRNKLTVAEYRASDRETVETILTNALNGWKERAEVAEATLIVQEAELNKLEGRLALEKAPIINTIKPSYALIERIALESRVSDLEEQMVTVHDCLDEIAFKPQAEPERRSDQSTYWWIGAQGRIQPLKYGEDHEFTEQLKTRGNLFKTKAEAEKHEARRLVLHKLEQLSSYKDQSFWYGIYHHPTTGWKTGFLRSYNYLGPRFTSEQSAKNAIKMLGTGLDILL